MNGQLWEECYCGTEPVCADCHKCEQHCTCGEPKTALDWETFTALIADTEHSMPHPAKRHPKK